MANGVRKNPDGSIDKLVNGQWVRQGKVGKPKVITPGKTKVIPGPTDGKLGPIKTQGDVTDTSMELGGASGQAFLNELEQIGKGKQNVIDTNYNSMTKDFAANKAQDLEAERQLLAERGIPIDYSQDPNAPTLYQKSINNVEKNYATQYSDAKTASLNLGNQYYNDSINNAATLGGTSNQFLNTLTQAYMNKYGIDKQAATQLATAKMNKGGGGGGSSGDSGGDIFLT